MTSDQRAISRKRSSGCQAQCSRAWAITRGGQEGEVSSHRQRSLGW